MESSTRAATTAVQIQPEDGPQAGLDPGSSAEALAAAQAGAWEWNLQTRRFALDPAWCLTLHIDPCAGPDHFERWVRALHPDDITEFRRRFNDFAAGRSPRFEAEYRVLTQDATWVWILQRGCVVERDARGHAVRATGICLEIDDRKCAEVALRENESRLATALWGARAAFWHWNIATDASTYSPLWYAMTGYTREQWSSVPRPWHSRVHPDDLPLVTREVDVHLRGTTQAVEVEYRIRTATGAWKWILMRGRVVEWDFDGQPTSAIGVSLDIDSQKRAELELSTTETRLETAVWGGGMGLWEMDVRTETTRWFGDWCERLDLHPCDGRDHVARWDSFIHPEDVDDAARRFADHIAGKEDHYDAEYRIRDRSGRYRWLFERGRVVERAPDGTALRMVGVCMDIDGRRHEEILRTQAHILETMREGVVLVDRDDRIRLTNPTFDAMFGYDAGTLLNQPVEPLFSMSGAKRQWHERARRDDALATAAAVEFECTRRDGSRFVASCVVTPLGPASNDPLLAVLHDVTERKQLEREIIEIANREQQRIGSDLHDGLGQDLTGIALMLRGIVGQLRREGSSTHLDVEDVIGLVNNAIESTRALARGLSPVSEDRGGLIAALHGLAAKANERYGIRADFNARLAAPLRLNEASATHIYRIVQEALTNVVRHSGASTVTITLETTRSELAVKVEDDGQGFGQSLVPSNGLGLKIMRYRAQMLGGDLALEASGTGGVSVRCWCPLHS